MDGISEIHRILPKSGRNSTDFGRNKHISGLSQKYSTQYYIVLKMSHQINQIRINASFWVMNWSSCHRHRKRELVHPGGNSARARRDGDRRHLGARSDEVSVAAETPPGRAVFAGGRARLWRFVLSCRSVEADLCTRRFMLQHFKELQNVCKFAPL